MAYPEYRSRAPRRISPFAIRLGIGAVIILFSLIGFLSRGERNEVTGEWQRVGGLTVPEEIQLGLHSVQEMAMRHHGFSRDPEATANVELMGQRLIQALSQSLERQGRRLPYQFQFHLLADPRTVNAFALPGGQVFITEALYRQFTHPGQLAGVLGHEVGHVLERHGAQQMAKSHLLQGMAGAAGVVGGTQSSVQAAAVIGNLVTMSYGRGDELESDLWGVKLMVMIGFKPEHMIEVMDILEKAGGDGPPDFLSTHPSPANRREHIESVVETLFPDGLPPGLR